MRKEDVRAVAVKAFEALLWNNWRPEAAGRRVQAVLDTLMQEAGDGDRLDKTDIG